ncbi:MAG TPA: MmcQ/YjbR family DNA-binding protein [Streptosporangiaceae bacterium]
MTAVASTAEIRSWATALPEVTEKQHFLFKVPQWQVRGRTFAGMGRDETTAVFCITEESATAAAAANPEHVAAVRRQDARRSFLGLEVQLTDVPAAQVEALVHEAWAARAPKTLARQRGGES